MSSSRRSLQLALAVLLPLVAAAGLVASARAAAPAVSVYASGLEAPRGLAFGPDGNLYVAEGGLGGTQTTTPAQCQQVPPGIGPYSGGLTGRISRVDSHGTVTTVVDHLPSSRTAAESGGLVSGVAAVAFVGTQLYAMTAGAGCSHGLAGTVNAVLRVNADGTTTTVADLSAFLMSHPVAHPEPDDFEPDGTWFSMVAAGGFLYAVEPNHGELDRIDPATGAITRVVDVSATQGHIVPSSLAYGGALGVDAFFVGNLGEFPIMPGSERILMVLPNGDLIPFASGLTTVLGLAVGPDHQLYALESMTAPGFPGPTQVGTGTVVRITASGAVEPVVTGLSFPTAMTFGPDGALYVSNFGFAAPIGQILRIDLSSAPTGPRCSRARARTERCR